MTREELLRLAHSKDWEERRNAARDPECPPDILAKLAGDENWFVREKVASHPNTPSESLLEMAYSEHSDIVIHAVLTKNPSTPDEALKRLCEYEHEAVRAAAREQLERRRRETTCDEYEFGMETSGMSYGGGP